MPKALTPLAGLLAALALAGPAAAQDPAGTTPTQAPVCSGTSETDPGTCTTGDAANGAPQQTVGAPTVVTDPAAEVDPTPPTPAAGDGAMQGEQHVLDATRSSSPQTTSQRPARRQAPSSARASAPAASAPAAHAAAAKTLPFTGVNAGYLALAGALLLGAGLAVRRTALGVRL